MQHLVSRGVYNGGVTARECHSIRDRDTICNTAAAMNFLIVAMCVCYAAADVSHLDNKDREAPIVKQQQDVSFDGNYNWEFETGNGIVQSAQGTLQNAQGENPAQEVKGQASWLAPNGESIEFTYTADAEGYHPSGAILPTPPPIPEEILKALEYIRTHPPKGDEPSRK